MPRQASILAVLLCLLVTGAQAIDPDRAISQYLRTTWTREQGFPGGPIYAITQTPDGYLWIGTESALVRFDGVTFEVVNDPSGKYPIAGVIGLTPDKDGNLWLLVRGPFLLRYRSGVFSDPFEGSHSPNVTAITANANGELVASATERGSFTFRQGRVEYLSDTSSLPRSPVISIAQSTDGEIWIGTRDAGLLRLQKSEVRHVSPGLPDPKVNCLLAAEGNALWVGTDGGIVRWDGRRLERPESYPALEGQQILALSKDRDGNLWLGTHARGLVRIGYGGTSFLDPSPAGRSVTAIFEDREGNLWFGGGNRIERLRESTFVTHSIREGMPSEQIGPVFAGALGRVWFAPREGGLYSMAGDGSVSAVAELGSEVVYALDGNENELWVGRRRGGLTQLTMEHGRLRFRSFREPDGLAQGSIYSVLRSRDNSIWAGTIRGGVSRLHGGTFTTFTRASGLASNTVTSIAETPDGAVHFGTAGGLSILSGGQWRTYTAGGAGLPAEGVNALYVDTSGVLWIGSNRGLSFLKSGRIHTVEAPGDFLREPVFGIADNGGDALWLSTSRRIYRVNREALLRGNLVAEDFREFGLADGLQSAEGVKRHRSVAVGPDGRIWFSMARGLSVVNPTRLSGSLAPAIARILSLGADGEPVAFGDEIHLPPDRRRIAFSFTGISLSIPERVRFQYTLDGFDTRWNGPISGREAVYTNLGPGNYRFRVRASNPDGIWNSEEAYLDFVIDPAFWQTLWFQVAIALLLAVAVLAFYRLRLRSLTERLNVRFEERLKERTRIAQELHDTLLQGFLSASMQLHVAVAHVPEDSPAKSALNRVIGLITRVTEEGRNAVWELRSPEETAETLENALTQTYEEFGSPADVSFRVIVEGRPRPLHPISRDELYRIGREALANAFRHSHAHRIEVEFGYGPKELRMLVRDDGRGIEPIVLESGKEGHWGIRGMRERAARIGGRLSVWSAPQTGTEIVLTVPAKVAYSHPPSPSPWQRLRNLVPGRRRRKE